MSRICIDLGATNIKSSLVENGKILFLHSHPTCADGGLESILAALKQAIDTCLDDAEKSGKTVEGICISSAGTIDSVSKKVVYATDNLPGYTGFDMGRFIHETYRLPCVFQNDGLCALLGEIATDESIAKKRVIMLTLGSGVGGAYAVNGRLVSEARNGFCLYGHFVMEENGIPCNCGKRGCIEQYLSGRAINRLAASFGIPQNEIFSVCQKGDPAAKKAVGMFRAYLRKALQTIEAVDGFDCCILGGGAAEGMRESFAGIVGGLGYDIRLAKAGNRAGMLGANAFFDQSLLHKN